MKAEEWRERVGTNDLYGTMWRDVIADLAESEREADILRDALAESERLRVEAEAKVAAYVKLLAQSSTQYREMVKVLDDYKAYYEAPRIWMPVEEFGALVTRIEARRERSTP